MTTDSGRNGEGKPWPTLLTGQAGVWQVASQLALRGLHPHFPGVDFGYDLLVDRGIRIQVKSARLRKQRTVYPDGAYWFKFWRTPVATRTAVRFRGAYDYSKVSDFVILWGIDEHRFWVVPSLLLAKTQCFIVGPQGFYKRQEFVQTKNLAAMGLSTPEIAARLGLTRQAVHYHLRGGRKRLPKRTVSAQVRECEDRWDLITGAVATLSEATLAVEDVPKQPDPASK